MSLLSIAIFALHQVLVRLVHAVPQAMTGSPLCPVTGAMMLGGCLLWVQQQMAITVTQDPNFPPFLQAVGLVAS